MDKTKLKVGDRVRLKTFEEVKLLSGYHNPGLITSDHFNREVTVAEFLYGAARYFYIKEDGYSWLYAQEWIVEEEKKPRRKLPDWF